jgi:hypothetical protein
MRPGSQHAQRASKTQANLLALLAVLLAALLAIKKMRPIIGKPDWCWLYCHLFVSL